MYTPYQNTRTPYDHFFTFVCMYTHTHTYIECPGGNVPEFGRMFLKLKYTDITKNTYTRSSTIMEIMTREV